MRPWIKKILNTITWGQLIYSTYLSLSLYHVNVFIPTNVVLLVVIYFVSIPPGALYIHYMLKTGGCHEGCHNDSFVEGGANHLTQIDRNDSLDICHTGVGGCLCGYWTWAVPVGLGSWWHLKQPFYWVKVRQLSTHTTHGATQLC